MRLSFWEIAEGDAVGAEEKKRKRGREPIRLKSAARRSPRAKRLDAVIALSTSSYKSLGNAIRFVGQEGEEGGGTSPFTLAVT